MGPAGTPPTCASRSTSPNGNARVSSRRRLEAYRLTVVGLAAVLLVTRLGGGDPTVVDPVIVTTLLLAGILGVQLSIIIGTDHKLASVKCGQFSYGMALRHTAYILLSRASPHKS